MQYDFSTFSGRVKEIIDWLGKEYIGIQSGKITPSLLDRVTIEAYGTKTALSHCSTITLEDQKVLLVTPYDTSLLPAIESELRERMPSMSLSVGDTGIRVTAQELTGERRVLLERAARERMEEAKQSIRNAREKEIAEIKHAKAASNLSEDEEFSAKKYLQEKVDEANREVDAMHQTKLQDIQI